MQQYIEEILRVFNERLTNSKSIGKEAYYELFYTWISNPSYTAKDIGTNHKAWGKRLRSLYPEVGRKHIKKYLYNSVGAHFCSKCNTLVPLFMEQGQARCEYCFYNLKKQYYSDNREYITDRHLEWVGHNRGTVNSNTAKYRANKLKRTPKWADLGAIARFYKECPQDMQVDHIIPLNGKLVSGLHVLSNLQYLSAKDNQSKSNQFKV